MRRERALRPPAGGRDRNLGAAQPLSAAGHRRAARRQDAPAAGRGAGGADPSADARAAHRRAPDRLAARRACARETSTAGSTSTRASTPRRSRSTAAKSRSKRSRRAALAASLAESQFWKLELQAFLGNAIGVRKADRALRAPPLPSRADSGRLRARHGLEPGALGRHGQRPDRRRAPARPLRVLVLHLRFGPSDRLLRAISSATRSRRRSVAPTRTAATPARATWW